MYLKQQDPERAFILDLESDDLDASVIWCVVTKRLSDGEVRVFTDAEEFNKWHSLDHVYIGHNILSFDARVLNNLWSSNIDLGLCVDTLVLSYLYNPAILGGHSLKAWGDRLGLPKGDFSDFSKYSDEMLRYCKQDVEVTYELYKQLTDKMRRLGYSESSAQIEHKIAIIIKKQEDTGCWFDVTRAESFRLQLIKEQSDLSDRIRRLFPVRRTKVAEYRLRRRKDGSPTASYETHRNKYPDLVTYEVDGDEWYDCYQQVPFNLKSSKQRVERLLELGWEPVTFTPKGSPKVDEDALLAFGKVSGRQEMVALAEYLVVSARLSMLAGNPDTDSVGWLGNVREDHRIHGRVFSCGAQSRRMTHNTPNTANVPSAKKAKYGKEMRSFWGVEPDKGLSMVGYDAKGLETECFKHWLNNPEANKVLDGDIHTDNARALSDLFGRPVDREWGAKTSWYAWMFGCYPPKLEMILKCTKSQAQQVWDEIYPNRIPGLKKFIESIQYEWTSNKGRLECIDGGFVVCPSKSSALNYKIQPTGAVVMKLTSIVLDETANSRGLWFRKLLDVHDEGQLETKTDTADELGRLAVWSIEEAARQLKFRVPLTGSYHIGTSWDQTH